VKIVKAEKKKTLVDSKLKTPIVKKGKKVAT